MAALNHLCRAGLMVELDSDRLRVTPADRITTDLRQFACDHRTELLAELSAANDARRAIELPHATLASVRNAVDRDSGDGSPEACARGCSCSDCWRRFVQRTNICAELPERQLARRYGRGRCQS